MKGKENKICKDLRDYEVPFLQKQLYYRYYSRIQNSIALLAIMYSDTICLCILYSELSLAKDLEKRRIGIATNYSVLICCYKNSKNSDDNRKLTVKIYFS